MEIALKLIGALHKIDKNESLSFKYDSSNRNHTHRIKKQGFIYGSILYWGLHSQLKALHSKVDYVDKLEAHTIIIHCTIFKVN